MIEMRKSDDCASITKIGVWLPTNCEHKLPYLCTTKPLEDCDVTHGCFIHRSQCLFVAMGNYDWYRARQICLSVGADLASFPDDMNKHELKKHIRQSPVWIGAIYNSGLCAWVDGTIETIHTLNKNSRLCGYLDVNTTVKQHLIGQSTCDIKMAALCEKITPTDNSEYHNFSYLKCRLEIGDLRSGTLTT
ncbi:hypothetical protein ACF0H5_009447 [Mactra antiquata]